MLQILVQVFTSGEATPSRWREVESLIQRTVLDTCGRVYYECRKSIDSVYSKSYDSFHTAEQIMAFKKRHFHAFFSIVRASQRTIEMIARFDYPTAKNLLHSMYMYIDKLAAKVKEVSEDEHQQPSVRADAESDRIVLTELLAEILFTGDRMSKRHLADVLGATVE